VPEASANVFYSFLLQATGGQPPYTWSSATLPAGLSLNADGLLSGTPAPVPVSTTFNFTATVSDNAGRSSARNLSITINP
jgi:Putative Ig domain